MEHRYWLGRTDASAASAQAATSAEARLIHFELAGRYSIKAAETAVPAPAPPREPLIEQAPAPAARANRPTTVERAFELARSGTLRGVAEIAAALKRERHESVEAHLAGPSIRRDLRRLWEAAA